MTDGVVAGDVLYISGDTEYTVQTRDSQTQLTLASNLASTVSGVDWKITHSRVVSNYGTQVKLLEYSEKKGFIMVYTSEDFSVSCVLSCVNLLISLAFFSLCSR